MPTILDDTLQIKLSDLRKSGYLEPGQVRSGTYEWSRNGQPAGSIYIVADTCCAAPFIRLIYKYDDMQRDYKVHLIARPSNLGIGDVWYFQCPDTRNYAGYSTLSAAISCIGKLFASQFIKARSEVKRNVNWIVCMVHSTK